MLFKYFVAATLGCLSLSSHADTTSHCALTDLTGVEVTKCYGFIDRNLINQASIDLVTPILSTFGVSGTGGAWLEKLDDLGGSHTINFTIPLSGDTIVALHFGNGSGGPGNGTAFYEFNAGASLDSFTTIYNASSNAAIYVTTPAPRSAPKSVPEPTSWALMLMGLTSLGLIGRFGRRRNKA